MKKACTLFMAVCLLQACSYYEMKEETAKRQKTWNPDNETAIKEESVCNNKEIVQTKPIYSETNPFKVHNEVSEFTIDARKDNLLYGKQGVKVFVPAGSFNSESNHLMVTMEEFTNECDLFLAQLTTHSNQTPLVSGGTIKLNAWDNGKEVGIKKGKEIAVIFKRSNNSTDEMMAFYGTRAPNGSMNWPSYTPSWKENFYESGFHPDAQKRQDSLFPEIKKLRDSIMQIMILTDQQRQWLNQESKCEKNPKFFLRKDDSKLYRLDKEHFTYNYGAEELMNYSLLYFRKLIHDSLVKQLSETVSFSPAIERKPFYEGEKDWVNNLVKNLKGDTNKAAAYMAQFALQNYVLRATATGFINCDRFYNYPSTDQEILVSLPEKFNGKVQLMIPAVNGVYEAVKKDKTTWSFAQLPKGLPCTLVAFTTEKGHIKASVKKMRTGNATHSNLVFNNYGCEEFVAMIKNKK